ncbi:MAG: cell division protein CrgA, partial [Brachybacterium alimentarium]
SKGSKGSKDGASSLAAGKDPVKKSRQKGSSAATPSGSEVTQKAKDASRTSSPKKAAAAESARTGRRRVAAVAPNPAWLAPTAVVFLVLGLLYLVTFYLSAGQLPLPIGDWNLAAGFGLMLVGGGMLMFWK